ncbi:MAG: dTMP kinase [Desulfosalsimonadaceae bacterium]|nr:dTMP kinase [Desulfosalsimonadaceae bacterium]
MLITLEGIEGSGKTTQIGYMAEYFRDNGHDCVTTKEPGGTGIGEKIRAILLNPGNHAMDPLAELLLYAADRAQHINEMITPMIAAGKIVICDRFHDSTTVYQGVARGLDMDLIRRLNRLVMGDLLPDMTVVLDLSPELGLKRAWKQIKNGSRDEAETRFENEKLQFHEKVRNGYLTLAKQEPDRFFVVDAAKDPDRVRAAIRERLTALVK